MKLFTYTKELAKKKGISIHKLEMQLGFPNATIRHWDESSPNFEKALKVARFFGMTAEDFAKGGERYETYNG